MNLTGRSYALVVLIALLGVMGQWGPEPLLQLWRLPAAALLLLLLVEGVTARGLQLPVNRFLPSISRLGATERGALTFHNPTAQAIALELQDEPPQEVESPAPLERAIVPADDTTRVPFQFTPRQLGTAQWRRLHLRIRGRFGLAWWTRRLPVIATTRVVPDRLDRTSRQRVGSVTGGQLNRARPGNGPDLLELREYRPGDPVNRIDWKATARSGRPTVKLLSEEEHLELALLLDVSRTGHLAAGGLSRLGHYINVAARLAELALYHGDRLHLIPFANGVVGTAAHLRGHAGLLAARRLLAELQPRPEHANHLAAALKVRQLLRRRALVVMLTEVDPGDASSHLADAVNLLRPRHLPLLAGIQDSEVVELAAQPPRHWLDPYRTLAATEMKENWRRSRYRLQRLGAQVVLERPEQLDQAVLAHYRRLRERRWV